MWPISPCFSSSPTMSDQTTSFRSCEAYFLSEGSLTYTWGENKVSFSEKDKFGWLVEICIWTPWVHVGELSTRTVSNVEIMQIEPFLNASVDR